MDTKGRSVFYKGELRRLRDISLNGNHFGELEFGATPESHSNLILPGLIDLQIYGAEGKLFSAVPSVETLIHIESHLLRTGTTGFLVCVATNTPEQTNMCIEAVKKHRPMATNCLGIHLEGPFLNVKRSGAHVKEYIRKASLDEIKKLVEFGDGVIKMITIAPETQDDAVLQYLLDQGIIVSLGHSDATYEQATNAYNLGLQTTTHLFNAMSPLHHRLPGVPAAVFNHPTALSSIIADGNHVDFEVVRLAYKAMGNRLFLITDAVAACEEGPYQHRLVGDKFVMPDGTLSGASNTLLQSIKNCVDHAGISLEDAVTMATKTPASLLKDKHAIGSIEEGYEANFIEVDADLNLKNVWYKGVLVKMEIAD